MLYISSANLLLSFKQCIFCSSSKYLNIFFFSIFQGYAQDLQSEYERAKDHVDEQYSKDPAIYLSRYQPKATNQRIEKAYHTVHLVRDEESKPSLAELRGRFQKGQSLYIESEKLGSPLGISVNKKAKRSFSLSMPSQNKLFKRRRVKFEETVTEEAENFV